jgi:hypothetical protein
LWSYEDTDKAGVNVEEQASRHCIWGIYMSRAPKPERHTDVAALAAAIVAVAVAMFVTPGRYDTIGLMVAVTLSLVVGSYVWGNSRTAFQSLAVGTLLGVIAMPIVGFVVELFLACDQRLSLLKGDKGDSNVNHFWLIGTWIIVATSVFVLDRWHQKRILQEA